MTVIISDCAGCDTESTSISGQMMACDNVVIFIRLQTLRCGAEIHGACRGYRERHKKSDKNKNKKSENA